MDVLVDILNKYNFVRHSTLLSIPIVIHSVPGAGKSSLIRELIHKDCRFTAVTYGEEDPPTISGVRIQKATPENSVGEFLLVDEYLAAEDIPKAFALFADPLQVTSRNALRAHFTKTRSHRFGRSTAQLLRDLAFEVEADQEDSVQVADLYQVDPRDQILYHEREVGDLLRAHGVAATCIEEARGRTFESVTFVTSSNSPIDRASAFQCLTRHKKSLLILCPNATYTAC
ncbi:triple gene block 1 protein [Mirabilis jalapa mottle virus]|uniref:Triple gene block 1 protein n=1 Tax=Mirabilis jalapa mottle virus TaxID=1093773 RepID=G5CCW6_9VIRU|nr:triple gene block 1 protein [Mirabilis jalapa mottle virus]AEQ35301.1 triple gene block 1 protein [Mirabilis jalapa mottle virus]